MGTSDGSENQQQEDVKVDILECGNLTDESQEGEDGLCQSSSSSFGDSLCARDDDDGDDDNDFEAESMLNKDYPLPETFGDGTELLGLKKKKVTDEWRKFCQPLMWRCKWLELKAKEIECQARGYDRQVTSYYQSKQFDLDKSKLEGFDGKSKSFGDQTQRMSVYKRGRRRRVEETTDVAAYISNHNVFSYSDKRKPTTLKAQCPVPGRKATGKEEEVEEDDCFVSGSDCSDDILGMILCQIDEAQDKAKRLKKRVDQLLCCESQDGHTSLMPQPSRRDFNVQNVKQLALVEEEPSLPHIQREGTVQIGRQRISADHTEDLLIPQAPPPFESDGQFLYNISPLPYERLGFPTIDDLLMDGSEMNDYEGERDLDNCFMKLMNEFGKYTMSDDDEEEEDPTPATKRHKTSH